MKKRITAFILFTLGHTFCLLFAMSFTFGLGMSRFDTGETEKGIIEYSSEIIVYTLGAPIVSAILALPTKGIPNALEWFLFLFNSALWGILFTWLLFRTMKGLKQNSPNRSEPGEGGNGIRRATS